jgi:hypothetical protein
MVSLLYALGDDYYDGLLCCGVAECEVAAFVDTVYAGLVIGVGDLCELLAVPVLAVLRAVWLSGDNL